jgi:carbon storage regulator
MLVLTRKKDQTIVINENVELTILEIQGDQVRLGITAPKSVPIHRKEVFLEIQEENRKAAQVGNISLNELMRKKKQQ